jgi:hypothetical protein
MARVLDYVARAPLRQFLQLDEFPPISRPISEHAQKYPSRMDDHLSYSCPPSFQIHEIVYMLAFIYRTIQNHV